MRKELYRMLCRELKAIDLIKHIDLWNHNVEFIEQEENWERPAVFVEFCPIQWNAIVPGVEYRAEPLIKLHIVTDWEGSSAEGSELQEDALKVFDNIRNKFCRQQEFNGKKYYCTISAGCAVYPSDASNSSYTITV